jgi:hypothetical protein
MTRLSLEWNRKFLALILGLMLALGASSAAVADGNDTQCNTNNGVTVCTADDVDDTNDDVDDTDDVDDGGSNNGGNNNDGDGIVNS